MNLLSLGIDLVAGWCIWSLSHHLGHRWWHDEMLHGKETFYAHGEREHHRVYDNHGAREQQVADDPKEMFISFPLWLVAPVALVFVAIFAALRGWPHALPFAIAMYGSMVADHQFHILFHKRPNLTGILGRFQRMHLIHHETHNSNFFFVSGYIWDTLFGTARTK